MYYCFRTLAALALAALASCATPSAVPGPNQVFVIRHLQADTGADPGLTAAGAAQAQALASWFRKSDAPRAIFVSRFRRTQDTAAPLAARLGIRPIVYDPANSDALVQSVKGERGNVLVVGHSNTVPDIVERLGGTRPAPIQHDQHGDIWRVSRTGRTEKLHLERR